MVGNPHRWNAVIPQLQSRNSTAGCLLVLLLILPFLSKTFHISINVAALFAVIYVSIIVPIGTGIVSKKRVIRTIRKLSSPFFDTQQRNYYLTQISYIWSWISFVSLQVDGVRSLMSQVIFSIASEKLFCPFERFSSLFALLFYTFLAYVLNSLKEKPWTRLFNDRPTTDLVKLTSSFVFLRLGKGIALSVILLTFGHRFKNAELNYNFALTTFFYFCITQPQSGNFIKSNLVNWVTRLELQCLDGLEEHWIPVLVHSSAIGISLLVFIGLLIHTSNYVIIIILGYINVALPAKHLLKPCLEELRAQKAIISKYSLATWNNPQIRGGYPCAICLDKMRILMARVTPCGHVFHGSCLRKCLHHSKLCPLCKTLI